MRNDRFVPEHFMYKCSYATLHTVHTRLLFVWLITQTFFSTHIYIIKCTLAHYYQKGALLFRNDA